MKYDQFNGFGIFEHNNNEKYHGNWKNNMQHGLGIEIHANNSRYEGMC